MPSFHISLCLTFTLYVRAHITSIDVPAGVCTLPFDTQLTDSRYKIVTFLTSSMHGLYMIMHCWNFGVAKHAMLLHMHCSLRLTSKTSFLFYNYTFCLWWCWWSKWQTKWQYQNTFFFCSCTFLLCVVKTSHSNAKKDILGWFCTLSPTHF